ncbi:DUF1853 family protein [Lishizhenia tianjinensis]|uniref:DUF1853 family protein n=1 Tax=Lishizhenia tianjinensis TaxID=477690 RepID=UPI00147D4BD3|nr:DUF1853 family protein [Lishizhenia tianjinensis]
MDTLQNNISKFQTPAIKDLVWALCSPCPLNEEVGIPLVSDAKKYTWYQQHYALLKLWDNSPEEFNSQLKAFTKNHRLGYYFEALMHTFFHLSPYIKVELANHQIIREKQTLGEIDFILKEDQEIYHLELAVKYYLQNEEAQEFEQWLGPNAKDNLAKKILKLKEHQLNLTQHLNDYKDIPSKALICGQFYQNSPLVYWQNEKSERKGYMKASTFEEWSLNEAILEYFLLEKPNWLSATVETNESLKLQGREELLARMQKSFNQKKAVHVGLLYKNGYTSIVLVPDAWPTLP